MMPGVKINETQRKALLEIVKNGKRALGVNPSTASALVRKGLIDRHVVMVELPYVYTATLAGRAAARRST